MDSRLLQSMPMILPFFCARHTSLEAGVLWRFSTLMILGSLDRIKSSAISPSAKVLAPLRPRPKRSPFALGLAILCANTPPLFLWILAMMKAGESLCSALSLAIAPQERSCSYTLANFLGRSRRPTTRLTKNSSKSCTPYPQSHSRIHSKTHTLLLGLL